MKRRREPIMLHHGRCVDLRDFVASSVELSRLRWRCRRGMLENDLILARFLDARGDTISGDEIAALDRLLDLTDNELWALLSGREEPADAEVKPLVDKLRAV